MRALRLFGDRDARLVEVDPPPPPGPGEIQLRMLAVALNHIDVWGWRGMAFAKRSLPMTIGAEAVGEVVGGRPRRGGVARSGSARRPTARSPAGTAGPAARGGTTCARTWRACSASTWTASRRRSANVQARLAVPVPDGVAVADAACAAITFSTVEHMLFDNAKLEPGETILIQAGGSGIGTVAIKQAKALGCTVIATAGSDEKCARMQGELGADHVVNYTTDRFESVCRRVTGKRGVDVVFEHVGAATWAGSLLSLRMGGRLVTCGSTSGVSAETNLMMLFQRQLRIIGSFGASMRNIADGLAKMAGGMAPVLDTVLPLEGFADALRRLESRQVFGKIVVTL